MEITIFIIVIVYVLYCHFGTFFKITLFFILMFCLYMTGQLILNTFGLLNESILSNKFHNSNIINAVIDVQIYLIFFLFGLCFAKKRNSYTKIYQYDKHALRIGYLLLLFAFPCEVLVSAMKITLASTYGYAALYQDVAYEAIPSSLKILSYFFMPATFYLILASPTKSKHEKFAIGLIFFHCISYMLMGYRAATIIPILLLLYALRIKYEGTMFRLSNKVKYILITLSVVLVLFVFPFMGANRNNVKDTRTEISITALFANNVIFDTIYEMGKSLQTVVYTRELVPEEYPYRYGYSYIMNFTTIIPNIFWEKHPAEVYGSLGRWLTKIVDYDFWEFGGALGYSCVAEAYINFGYWGIMIIAFLLGYFLLSIENIVDSFNSPVVYASFVIIAINLMAYPRGEFGEIVRCVFWYMLIPKLLYTFTKKRK